MLLSGWSRFVLRFLTLPVSVRARQSQLVSPSPSCSTAFSVLWQGLSTYISFRFLLFSLWGPLYGKFLFFFNYHYIWSLGQDQGIRLYLKITEKFMRLILWDGFEFVDIPFGSMVKFQFFAQFPVDQLLHPVVPTLALLQC